MYKYAVLAALFALPVFASEGDHGISEFYFQADHGEILAQPHFTYSVRHTHFASDGTTNSNGLESGIEASYGITQAFSLGTDLTFSSRGYDYSASGNHSTYGGLNDLNLVARLRLPADYGIWHFSLVPSFSPTQSSYDQLSHSGNAFSGGQSIEGRVGLDHRMGNGMAVGARAVYFHPFDRTFRGTSGSSIDYVGTEVGGSSEDLLVFAEAPMKGWIPGLSSTISHGNGGDDVYADGSSRHWGYSNTLDFRLYATLQLIRDWDILPSMSHTFQLSGDPAYYTGFNTTGGSLAIRRVF
jgi:hypothetical protein